MGLHGLSIVTQITTMDKVELSTRCRNFSRSKPSRIEGQAEWSDTTSRVSMAHRAMRLGGYKSDVLQGAARPRTSVFARSAEMFLPVQWR